MADRIAFRSAVEVLAALVVRRPLAAPDHARAQPACLSLAVEELRPRGWRGRHMSGAAGWIVLALGLAFTLVVIVLACGVKP